MNIIRGILTLLLYSANFIFCALIIFLLAPLKLLRTPKCKQFVTECYRYIPVLWGQISNLIINITSNTEWDIRLDPRINKNESYILIANHQSWFDIITLQRALNNQAPSSVYFMKRALLWIPFMGWGCWLLDFPILYRFSSHYLAKHPEKRGLDLQMMRRACERYRSQPVTFINFAEGTRFHNTKHAAQNSPYQHLLKPRAGGLAFTLSIMRNQIQYVLDATIVYSPDSLTLWEMLYRKNKKIIVDIKCLKVDEYFRGSDKENPQNRQQFQQCLNQVWQKKDELIKSIREVVS